MMHQWIPINEGIDRRIDGDRGYYAEAGPDADGRWSFTILRRPEDGGPSVEIVSHRNFGDEHGALFAARHALTEAAREGR